jgi:hypothetical protein
MCLFKCLLTLSFLLHLSSHCPRSLSGMCLWIFLTRLKTTCLNWGSVYLHFLSHFILNAAGSQQAFNKCLLYRLLAELGFSSTLCIIRRVKTKTSRFLNVVLMPCSLDAKEIAWQHRVNLSHSNKDPKPILSLLSGSLISFLQKNLTNSSFLETG